MYKPNGMAKKSDRRMSEIRLSHFAGARSVAEVRVKGHLI
jgi:hypothetical protein